MATEHDAAVGDMNVESAEGPVSTQDVGQDAGGCPVAHGEATYPVEGGNSNQRWWPTRLNLRILAKNPAETDPMGDDFDYAAEFSSLDLAEVKRDIEQVLVTELVGQLHEGADIMVRVAPDDPQTVMLWGVTDAGLVRRIQPAGSVARYEARVGDNHHHLVCRSCGTVVDVDCAVGVVPCLTAADDQGFVIDEAEVTYWGLCPSCAAHAPHPA